MTDFSIKSLKGKKRFHYIAGVSEVRYDEMVKKLEPYWDREVTKRKVKEGRPYGVGGLEDHLLVLLILYRCHITQEFLGLLYRVDKATISRSLGRIEKIAVRVLGIQPRIEVSQEEAQFLLFDCTEQRIERPQRNQENWYSGKKKAHTLKTEMIVTAKGRIAYVSQPLPGRIHDIEVRRQGPPLPKGSRGHVDSGYQGYQLEHPHLEYPYKKSKNKALTDEERDYNRALSSFRVGVEHAFARVKTFRVLSDRYRYPRPKYHTKFSIIAGIVNLAAGF